MKIIMLKQIADTFCHKEKVGYQETYKFRFFI